MNEMLTIIFIGIALSMDAFSLSLALGTIINDKKAQLYFAIIVGCFHFIMPLIGTIVGMKIISMLNISMQILISAILVLIAFEMIKDVIDSNRKQFNLTKIRILILAVSVSFDSFSVGIGIKYFSSNLLLSSVIFALFSSMFTYTGLRIGKYTKKLLGVTSNVVGAIILIVISLISLCK